MESVHFQIHQSLGFVLGVVFFILGSSILNKAHKRNNTNPIRALFNFRMEFPPLSKMERILTALFMSLALVGLSFAVVSEINFDRIKERAIVFIFFYIVWYLALSYLKEK